MTDPADRSLLAATAALLTQGRTLDHLSRLLTAGALFGLLAHAVVNDADPMLATLALLIAALAGFVQTYYAVRVGFDAALFRQFAETASDLAVLDATLDRLGLLPAEKIGRPIEARIAGARALLRMQTLALMIQIVVVLCAALFIALT
ncbi:MAG: hypothetical protein JWN71_2610 [Xanthobacteraceae bacterium]|jgi:hypothetical protein|nr:hypothetical protein [Xanthobacteraceae bacterium]